MCFFPISFNTCGRLRSNISGHDYKGPQFLAWAPSLGLVKQTGSWLLSPGHVPRPLPGLPRLVESLLLATSLVVLNINWSPLRPLIFIKMVALGSPRALGGCTKPATADKPGHLSLPTCFALFFLSLCLSLSEMAPHSTSLWALGYGLLAGFCTSLVLYSGFFPLFLFVIWVKTLHCCHNSKS